MDLKPFKLDIDELISEFAEGGSTSMSDLKRIWLSKKFTYIFEASPSSNQACFIQSLFSYCIGYVVSTRSLSHRLGGLYCLYCLVETQPFRPPFKIYLSLGELKKLGTLVGDAKAENIEVVCGVVKRMLDKNMFLLGVVDINESSASERIADLTKIQNAQIRTAYDKLFGNTNVEVFTHLDMGLEVGVDSIKQKSTEYAMAKKRAIKEASRTVDVENIKHIAEAMGSIGDVLEQSSADWNAQKEAFYQQTGVASERMQVCSVKEGEDEDEVQEDNDGNFSKELEDAIFSEQLMLEDDE